METAKRNQIEALWKLSRNDSKCCEIRKRYDELEKAFEKMTAKLSEEDQDIAWGFVCTSDELDIRLMELMCELFSIDPVGYLEREEIRTEARKSGTE